MGNVLAHPGLGSADAEQDDLRYLSLSSSALFLDSFVSQEFDQLPVFKGTELPERSPEEQDGDGGSQDPQRAVTEDGKTRRLLEILLEAGAGAAGQVAPTPAAAVRVEDGRNGGRGAAMLTRMRSRMLQRIHLAILRESERVRRAAGRQRQQGARDGDPDPDGVVMLLDGEQQHQDEDDAVDGAAVLNMASMRVSLSVLKAVAGSSNTEIFVEFCQSLLGLFQASPPSAFAEIQRHRAQRETLEQIRDFARAVVLRPVTTAGAQTERDYALALLFGLGVARGSVHDLVEVAALLADPPGGDREEYVFSPLLCQIPAVRPFWERLTRYEHRYQLAMVNPLEPDGPEILIQQAGGRSSSSTAATDLSGTAGTSAAVAAIASDGAFLYIWNAARASLEKVGTGRQGTVAGKVYLRNADVLRVVKLLGVGAGEPSQSVGAEVVELEGEELQHGHTRAMVRIRRRSSTRDEPDAAAAVRATLAVGEEHEVIEEEMGPGNLHWVRVRAGWLLDADGEEEEEEEEDDDDDNNDDDESKEEETLSGPDLSQSMATSGFPDISSLGGLGASVSASSATPPRPSAPVPGLSPSRPSTASSSVAALEFFRVRAEAVAPAGPAAADEEEDPEAAWLAHIDGKLYFTSKNHMAPLDLAVLSAATLRVERVLRLDLPGHAHVAVATAEAGATPAATEEQPQEEQEPPAVDESPASATPPLPPIQYADHGMGARAWPEDADVAAAAGVVYSGAVQRGDTPAERALVGDAEAAAGDDWRGFPLPPAEEADTSALRTVTLDLGEPRPLMCIGAEFTRGAGANLSLVLLYVSRNGQDFRPWPDPSADPATSPPEEDPPSPYFVAAPAPVLVRFVRFGFALDHGGEGVLVQRLHAQGPPRPPARAEGAATSSGAAALAASPRRPEAVVPSFTTDGRLLYLLYVTPNGDKASAPGAAAVDPEAEGAAPPKPATSTLHVAFWLPGNERGLVHELCSVPTSTEQRAFLRKALVTNGHQLLTLSLSHGGRAAAARGRVPIYHAMLLSLRHWPSGEFFVDTLGRRRFVFEGGNSSAGGLPAATPSFLPRAFTYDPHNNVLWGAEPFADGGGKVASWRNAGNLAPPIHPRFYSQSDPGASLVPEFRRESLLKQMNRPRTEGETRSGCIGAQAQAALILSCLDHCAEPYGAGGGGLGGSSHGAGPALEPLSVTDPGSHELLVVAASKEDGIGQRRARFVVRGQTLASSALATAFERGLNLVRLDARYAPVETRGFDTTGRSGAGSVYNDVLLEYVSRLPEGTVVLVASQEDAGRGLTPAGQSALQMLGGDRALLDRFRDAPNDSNYALIGRKGAQPTSAGVVQRLAQRGDHASVRLRLPVVPVPLCVEPTPRTLRALVRVVLTHKEVLLGTPLPAFYEGVHVLSALSLLTANIHQLMRASSPAAAATVTAQQVRGLFEPAELEGLQDFLVQVLAAPRAQQQQQQAFQLVQSLGEAALRLYVTALDVFHPTPSGQCALLAQLMGRYAKDALSPLEAAVLGLLLKRIANPSSLLALLDEQHEEARTATVAAAGNGSVPPASTSNAAAHPSLDLFRTILGIAQGEVEAALGKLSCLRPGDGGSGERRCTSSGSGGTTGPSSAAAGQEIGHAAVTMLASLTNQLLSQTVQSVLLASETVAAASKGSKEPAVASTAGRVLEGSLGVLLEIVGALGTSCQTLLDAALAVLEEQQEEANEPFPRASSSFSLSPSHSGLLHRPRALSTASLSSVGGKGAHGQPQPSPLWRDLEAALQASPVGALLPLVVLVVMEVTRYQAPTLLPALHGLVRALAPLTQRVHRLVAYLHPAATGTGTRVAAVGGCTTRQQVFESSHPYLPNTDQTFVVHFPKATRIVIEFDSQTRTETNYDYVQFFRDGGRTQSWHPAIERFSGRSGNETWPGFGQRPPLVIEGDLAYCFFHSDSSNEDWGWRFTATAYYKKQAIYEDAHWLLLLERHLNACNAALASGLIASVRWQGELEERNRPWLEGADTILYGSAGSTAPHPPPQQDAERAFLHSLITRPPGSPAAALVQAMRRLVAGDRGRHLTVDGAVYASVAALLQHNGLVREAMALAERVLDGGGVMPEGTTVSPALLRAWRGAAKMRHFFAFADVRAGLQGPGQGQLPPLSTLSLYDGAEDAVVEAAAKEVVGRAQFLLGLPPPSSSSPLRRGRALSQHLPAAAAPAGAEAAPSNKEGQWAAVVQELHASSPSIMEVFAHRRREAERMQASQLTTTERVLRFLQAPVKVGELNALQHARSQRAAFRAQGLELLTDLLTQTVAVPMQVDLLVGFMRALRETPPGADAAACPPTAIHVRAGVAGCSPESANALESAFARLLHALVEILRTSLPFFQLGAVGGAADARKRLALAALKACTLDYDARQDHALLDASGLLPTLGGYLAVPNPTLRAAAWALLESLLPRPPAAAAASSTVLDLPDAAGHLHRELLGLVFRQLELTVGRSASDARLASEATLSADSNTPWALSRETVGRVVPYTPMSLGTTFALWLLRTRAAGGGGEPVLQPQDPVPPLKPGNRVLRGPDWCDGDEDGWVGNVGTVIRMETPTAVIVEWDGLGDEQFIYRWGAVIEGRKMYDLELVRDEASGGLLLFKGTESLLGPATPSPAAAEAVSEEDADAQGAAAAAPWSALGLSLTDTSRLLFRTCAAGEGLRAAMTFAVLGNRPLPFGEWVHVACDISKKSVVLYVNGEVDAEKPLPPSLLYQHAQGAAPGAEATPIEDFNPSPLFVGQPPSYATVEKGAECLLQGLAIARRSLPADEIKGLAAQRPHAETETPTAVAQGSRDGRLLDVISLTRKCLQLLPLATVHSAITPTVVQSVLGLALGEPSTWGLQVRVAATRLSAALLPFVGDRALAKLQLRPTPPAPKASTSLAGKGAARDDGQRSALVASILEAVGAFVMAPHLGALPHASPTPGAVEGAESRAALAYQRLALVRSLAQAEAWSGVVLDAIAQVLKSLPALLAHLESRSEDETAGADGVEPGAAKPLPLAAAVLALLGGYVEGLTMGADVLVEVADRKGCVEEGIVLALTHAAAATASAGEKGKDKPPRGVGEAVVVVLRSDPARPQVYPRERVAPQPCRDQAAFLGRLAEKLGAEALLDAFRCLVGQELRSPLHRYAPKVVEEVQTHVVESPHPHERGADLQALLRFPGAKSIEIVFDEQSRTAWGKTYVQLLKGKESLEWYGKERYQGRDREQCWAGAHGSPPLVIPATSCVVRFISDAHEEPDWGFKLTARAHTVRAVPPPELPPSRCYAARAQLCMQGTKALSVLLLAAPALGKPAASGGLLRALVGSALARDEEGQARGRYRRKATPLELESGHPYSNNEERYEEIAFPGAKRLVVKFDPKSSSEKGCDFVRIYKDDTRTAYWGEAQYTGGKDGSAALWPGVGACPPLVISSDHCVLYFHSDGSVVDWGWRCWVTPDFGDGDWLESMGLEEVGARVFTLHQCLSDGAKPQAIPAELASFQQLHPCALAGPAAPAATGPDSGDENEEALASLCSALSLGEAPGADDQPHDEDAAVLALAKAQSRAKVVGRRFVVNRRDAGSVAVRAAPDAAAAMLGMLDAHDQPVLALEERDEWVRIDWKAEPAPAAAWVQRRRSDLIFLVPADEDGSGGAQDALLVLPNEELEDDDAGVQPRRGNSMYECVDAALVGSAAAVPSSTSSSTSTIAGVTGLSEDLHPAEHLQGQQERLASALTELQVHAARGFAKRSVAALLLQWPEAESFELATAFGGPRPFLRFLAVAFEDEKRQAAAAAAVAGGATAAGAGGRRLPGAGGDDSPLLQVLHRTIRQVLEDDDDGNGEGTALSRTLLAFALRQLREAAGLYASVTPTRGLVKAIETPHPYPDNADLSWTISFPGANRLKLVWDPRSSTEPNCDYVVMYRDTDHSDDNRVSPIHYSGRANDMEASWPGVGGRPPVYVEADHVDVVFRSDASNTDWGCKIYAYGLFKEPSAEELVAFRAKKKALRSRLALACWLLDVLAAESLSPLVARALFAPATLAAVTEYIALVGPRERVWMVHLACSLLSHLQQPPAPSSWPPHLQLPPRSVAELCRLVAVLRSQAHAQFALEDVADASPLHDTEDSGSEEDEDARRQRERQEGHHKSALLQTLIQATLLGEACPLLMPSSSSSSSPAAATPPVAGNADASAMDLWLGTAAASTREAAMPGSSQALTVGEGSSMPVASSSSSSGGGAQALRKLRAAVDYMRAFVDRTLPAEAVQRFLAEEAQGMQKLFVSVGSPDVDRPDPGAPPLELMDGRVHIPGAIALEVRFDASTRLEPRDTIRVAGTDDAPVVVLRGMDRGSDPDGAEQHGLCVGDLVVRGPGWCWGNEDGGPGGVGEVVELRAWKGRPAKGARVRWRNGRTGLYRWAYEGVFDVAYLRPGERSTRPIRVRGNRLRLTMERLAPSEVVDGDGEEAEGKAEESSAAEGEGMVADAPAPLSWRGALCFDGPRPAVTIPSFPAAELTGDFTVAMWVNLDAEMAGHVGGGGGAFTLVARALEGLDDGNGAPVHQLHLSVEAGSGQLVLSMQNQQMRTGVRLVGSSGAGAVLLERARWAHVAVTMEGQRVRLFLDGAEVASGLFGGQRLISMGAPLCLGALLGRDDSLWEGHMWDFRLYDRALPVQRLRAVIAQGLGGDLSGQDDTHARGLICHLLTSPEGVAPRALVPRRARHAIVLDNAQGMVEVQDCSWDEEIGPPSFPGASQATEPTPSQQHQQPAETPTSAGAWGYRITVLPIFPTDPAAIARIPILAERFAAFAAPYTAGSFMLDLALARHVNRVAQQRRWGVEELLACRRFEEVAPKEEDLVRLPLLRELVGAAADSADPPPTPVATCRFAMLQQLNRHVREVMLLIDLGSIDRSWSVAHLLSRCRGLVYHSVKAPCWQKALAATACVGTVAELHLSRSRAAKLQASGLVDHEARATVFGQAFRALHGLAPRGFRRADKAWNVVWMGERAQDAGGPYRESWSVFSLELQSPALPLLRRTPNGVHAVGQNREHWVLNPGATGELALQLFAFVGKLMGMVMRNGELLHLDLSPLVWKLLASEPLTAPQDLEAVDVEIARSLRLLRGMDRAEFEAAFADHLEFTCVSTDGRAIALVPGGAARAVGYDDRLEYARLVEQYRLHEFDAQAAAVRAGLATIVPARLLALFTWEEIEVMVCGLKHVDVGLLRQVTEYSAGVHPDAPHVRHFWQVLEEWTDEERSMFIRFCWGRSRLPLRAEDFPQRFKIQHFGRSPPDNYLPVAHTCFFSIELPAYSSLEVCRRKLTLAISACTEIDADDNAIGAATAAMGWEE